MAEGDVRLFVAADLPAGARAALAAHATALVGAGGWRAVPDASLHLTLAFLGARPPEDVGRVAGALPSAVTACGATALGEPVLLPRRAPRVAAVRLRDDDGDLARLAGAVGRALQALGVYEPERRAYLPHVTVARRTKAPLGDAPEPAWSAVPPFHLPSVTLYRSKLSRAGAAYEALETVTVPVA